MANSDVERAKWLFAWRVYRKNGTNVTGGFSHGSLLAYTGEGDDEVILPESIIESQFLVDLLRQHVQRDEAVVEIVTGETPTAVLSRAAAEIGASLRTVGVSASRSRWEPCFLRGASGAKAVCQRGERIGRKVGRRIGFAYVNGYDWVDSGEKGAGSYPPGLTRRESELVHLELAFELLPLLTPRALVLFDDTWFVERRPPGSGVLREKVDLRSLSNRVVLEEYEVIGKGSLAVPFLLCMGFGLVAVSERPHATQILLRRKSADAPAETLPYDEAYFRTLFREHRAKRYSVRGEMRAKAVALLLLERAVIGARRLPPPLRSRLRTVARRLGLTR